MSAGMQNKKMISKIGFGGGCHWCTEAVFSSLAGVARVEQGFIRSSSPADTWSEAVLVSFKPEALDLETLIDIHVQTHSAFSQHKLRGKYRSAVYFFNESQALDCRADLARIQSMHDEQLVTQVLPFVGFKASDKRFQNYFENDPDRPFCRTYIMPKLKRLQESHPEKLKRNKHAR